MEKSTHIDCSSEFCLARRPTFLKINLDTILSNLEIVKRRISAHTEIIAVVKANAYGHGSVEVAKFLEGKGFQHFAVASALEGEELRSAGIQGNIQVLGNASDEEIPTLYDNRLIPTVADVKFLSSWHGYCTRTACANGVDGEKTNGICAQNGGGTAGQVVIKVDSGMSRNGCQPEQLPDLVQFCQDHSVPIHSMMTHFAQSWDDPVFTQKQMDVFMAAVRPYRGKGIKLHVANSGAIANKVGIDLDFVRPGISMYGQAPDTSEFGITTTEKLGYKPAMAWRAKATLVKEVQAGHSVGYDHTYTCSESETIATIPVGYADGYLRNMFGKAYVTTSDGTKCPVVGRISMDSITVRLPESAKDARTFDLVVPNFNQINSSVAIARILGTIPYEVCTNMDRRVPRLYIRDGVTSAV